MEYYTIVGLVVVALIAILGGFGAVVKSIKDSLEKDKKPLEDLNLTITKLNTNFENMLSNNEVRDRRINKHGEEIDRLSEKYFDVEKGLIDHEARLGNVEKRLDI